MTPIVGTSQIAQWSSHGQHYTGRIADSSQAYGFRSAQIPLPRHWNGGDAFKTHLFDAMSVLFPDGERFFIDSVRQFRDRIDDPVLNEQIRGFIGQEGHHSREHLEYSQRLCDLGYDVERIEKPARTCIRYTQRKFSP